jgi:hypothetical protein
MSPRAYTLGKRTALVEDTRRRVLEAAIATYARSASATRSVQAIARRADVAAGTVRLPLSGRRRARRGAARPGARRSGVAEGRGLHRQALRARRRPRARHVRFLREGRGLVPLARTRSRRRSPRSRRWRSATRDSSVRSSAPSWAPLARDQTTMAAISLVSFARHTRVAPASGAPPRAGGPISRASCLPSLVGSEVAMWTMYNLMYRYSTPPWGPRPARRAQGRGDVRALASGPCLSISGAARETTRSTSQSTVHRDGRRLRPKPPSTRRARRQAHAGCPSISGSAISRISWASTVPFDVAGRLRRLRRPPPRPTAPYVRTVERLRRTRDAVLLLVFRVGAQGLGAAHDSQAERPGARPGEVESTSARRSTSSGSPARPTYSGRGRAGSPRIS